MALSISCAGDVVVGVTMWDDEFTGPPRNSVVCLDYLMDCSAFHGVRRRRRCVCCVRIPIWFVCFLVLKENDEIG